MGARGPKPRVKADLTLRAGVPDAPDWLDDVARTEYQRVADVLTEAGVLSHGDYAHLVSYSQAWSDFVRLNKSIAVKGETIENRRGTPVLNPEVAARTDAHRRMIHSAQKLGLSVMDRDRLKLPNGGKGGVSVSHGGEKSDQSEDLEDYLQD
jgi:P27 family predicted phage terminase small subunit